LTLSAMAPIVAGFYLASHNQIAIVSLIWTVIGAFLAAAGASAFNQWFERDTDRLMDRTKNRAIPSGNASDGGQYSYRESGRTIARGG
ncbi:MAG: UbiA family prenyltransferase, partial [Chloroflexi bacterium]|nr:UbiA family prenyltransferase [Chloroflexota bacterium]